MPSVEKKKPEMSAAARLIEYVVIVLESVAPVALVGVGAWWIYPPASLLTMGAMLWFDYMRKR